MDINTLITRANRNMASMFPRHTPITNADVEKVYGRQLLSIEVDVKTRKGSGAGYLTGILYLAPANVSGVEVCPGRSVGCTKACLFTAGRGAVYSVTRARVVKTIALFANKTRFVESIKNSINKLVAKARKRNMIPVVRLNGTSDLLWERNTDIMQSFPDIQFYDYTKIEQRFNFNLPKNYSLTFSVSEENREAGLRVLARGGNIAVVFGGELPSQYLGHTVTDGDVTDLRFLDEKQVIVGLKAKGKAKRDVTGFVVRL